MKLIDYIKGNRRGPEANRLEREAMNDPFLHEAIEGFDAVPGDHPASVRELEKRLQQRISRKRSSVMRWWISGVAAAVALLLGVGGMFLFSPEKMESPVAKTPRTIIEQQEKLPVAPEKQLANTQKKNTPSELAAVETVPPAGMAAPSPVKIADTSTVIMKGKELDDLQVVAGKSSNGYISTASATVQVKSRGLTGYLDSMQNSRAQQMLAGKVAGASVQTSDSPPSIRIRGISSLSANYSNPVKLVQGRVLDEKGDPVVGANVMLGNNATITNVDGHFQVQPTEKAKVLKVKFIGYQPQEVKLTDSLNTIRLQPDNLALNEVVVVGYGVQKKSSMTGAVTAVKTKKVFGKAEFEKYFEQHRQKEICIGTGGMVKVELHINEQGKPENIEIKKSTCDELRDELIRLLHDSPVWTTTKRDVTLKIKIP